MRKRRAGNEEITPASCRDRVLARVLAEDLRAVRGAEDELAYAVTDPPPGRDVTFHGSDNGGETF